LIFPLKHCGVSSGIAVNKGVIGFSRKVERKSLLLDRILKEKYGDLSTILEEILKQKANLHVYQLNL
jgi:hypothetical protein